MSLTERLVQIRASHPERIAETLATRPRGVLPSGGDRLMVIACDHPARGALGAGRDDTAMASREDLLGRCVEALSRPGVNGFLGTADMIEDLALLGALDGKLVFGSMNRGGLKGASFEMDDRFTCYDARGVVSAGLDGGKMLLRINYSDPGSANTLEACAHAVDELAEHRVMAIIEPFVTRWRDDRIVNDLSPEAVMTSMAIASGLGRTSAYTWLKLPVVANMERVLRAGTLPVLLLGGAVPERPDETLEAWRTALTLPTVRGLVIGRSLLFPPSGDVAAAVDETVGLL